MNTNNNVNTAAQEPSERWGLNTKKTNIYTTAEEIRVNGHRVMFSLAGEDICLKFEKAMDSFLFFNAFRESSSVGIERIFSEIEELTDYLHGYVVIDKNGEQLKKKLSRQRLRNQELANVNRKAELLNRLFH